jgi:xanthine dehydrogenase accessory factor
MIKPCHEGAEPKTVGEASQGSSTKKDQNLYFEATVSTTRTIMQPAHGLWSSTNSRQIDVQMNSSQELGQLLVALRNLSQHPDSRAALATLVRTHGSTFRRPGTRMLVHADGSVVCELSGGCPQRDIVMRAQQVIASGVPRLVNYNADSGLDVLLEMGCGGELEVLLDPLNPAEAAAFANALDACLQQRDSAWLATVFAIDEHVAIPRRLLWSDQTIRHDGFDNASLTALVTELARKLPTSRKASTHRLAFGGGSVDVLIEPIQPTHALVVVGNSAAARALLPLSLALGWITTWVDSEPARMSASGLPQGLITRCATPETLADMVKLDHNTSVIVITHNLEQDVAWLAAMRDAPLAYLGTLGSRERVGRMRKDTQVAGLRLHAPAGLDIGSETPQEIALAVAAEVMAVINRRSGGSLRDNDGAIH